MNEKSKNIILNILIIICLFINSFAEENSGYEEIKGIDELKNKVSSVLKKTDSIKFVLHQNTYIGTSTNTIKAEVYFEKPDKLKVKYTQPQVQEIIYSQGYLYTYVPEISQVTRQKREGISDVLGVSPSILLKDGSFENLKNDFDLEINKEKSTKDFICLQAEPLNRQDIEKMNIFFSRESFLVKKNVLYADNLKSVTEFNDYVLDPEVGKDFFSVEFPEDVNIIKIE
ncbi:MAG: LolA family protein [Elusimicrobiota bacterium]